jgi:tight adherence protein C
MSAPSIIIAVGVAIGVGACFALVYVLVFRNSGSEVGDRWNAARMRKKAEPEPAVRKPRAKRESNAEPLAERLVRPLARLWAFGDTSQSRIQEILVHAGVRERGAVEVFLGAKFALALALPAAVVAFSMWRANASGTAMSIKHIVIYGACALIAGMILPNMWLNKKAKKRIERVRMSLPDALDLLIVCVESGLGLDAALVRISKELADVAPEFCDELQLLNLEVSAGKPRDECLRNLALRTGCDEVESLTARINQAARYGTNLGHSLRIHSESLRQKRRQEAEERAAKTSVKLLFPLVFFIFPAIFVVILGPAVAKVLPMFSK